MAKYHDTGTICKAEQRACPLGLSEGEHIEAANEKDFEKKLEEKYGNNIAISKIKKDTTLVALSTTPSSFVTIAQESYRKAYNKNLKISEVRKTKKEPVDYYFFAENNGKEEYVMVPSTDSSLHRLQIASKELSENFKETDLRPLTKHKTTPVSFERVPKDFILAARAAYQREFGTPVKGFYQILKTKGWDPNYYFLVDNPETNSKSYMYVPRN